jgi:hypothetical protein
MKKLRSLVIAALLFCSFSASLYAQDEETTVIPPMTKGTVLLNVGFGPATHWAGYYHGFAPGFMVAVDAGLWELGPGILTIGGEFGWDFSSYHHTEYNTEYTEKYMSVTVAARSTYHYGWNIKGLDTYGGIALGGRIPVYHKGYYNDPQFGLGGGFFVGASYFFTPVIGVNAELGYNITYIQAGMVFILKE